MMLEAFLGGLLGGAVRGIAGYLKKNLASKKEKFNFQYFILIVVLSGIVGSSSALVTSSLGTKELSLQSLNFSLAFLIGYAGSDFLESLYKIILKKK